MDSSIIGVGVAILGNIFISIALNIQKYVHNSIKLPSTNIHLDGREMQPQSAINGENSSYITSPLWWVGMVVMMVGELGNFSAYGFAPAVLVAPLGTVALISNILIAPIFLGERMRSRDFFGILAAVVGTCIILAVSSGTSEPPLSADDILTAIFQPSFSIYILITITLIFVLWSYSNTEYANQYVLIDLLIASLVGGYTVLSIKALSSLLKMDIALMFSHWITYLMLLVLVGTGVLQIKFLNKALSAFDSVEVIPINFVLFTTFSIIGSSVLYHDLSHTSPFALVGVICMFFGVVLITSKDEGEKTALYSQLENEEVVYSPLSNSNTWNNAHSWAEEVADQVPTHPISFGNDIPHINFPASSLPLPTIGRGPRPINPRRRTSFDNGADDTNTLKRLSGMFQAVGSSVGTHAVRQMEFDLCSEVHSKNKSPRVSSDV